MIFCGKNAIPMVSVYAAASPNQNNSGYGSEEDKEDETIRYLENWEELL